MKIMVVEDEGIIAMLLEDMLCEAGHTVCGPAANLRHAEELALADRPDIAIMDLNLNGQRPFALARDLRAAGVAIIFATGYGSSAVTDADLSDAPVLTKPFDSIALRAAISKVAAQA